MVGQLRPPHMIVQLPHRPRPRPSRPSRTLTPSTPRPPARGGAGQEEVARVARRSPAWPPSSPPSPSGWWRKYSRDFSNSQIFSPQTRQKSERSRVSVLLFNIATNTPWPPSKATHHLNLLSANTKKFLSIAFGIFPEDPFVQLYLQEKYEQL